MKKVNSSNLKEIGYNPDTKDLFVRIQSNGKLYKYSNVPMNLFEGFVNAESHGRFFVREIKDKFETKKIED